MKPKSYKYREASEIQLCNLNHIYETISFVDESRLTKTQMLKFGYFFFFLNDGDSSKSVGIIKYILLGLKGVFLP